MGVAFLKSVSIDGPLHFRAIHVFILSTVLFANWIAFLNTELRHVTLKKYEPRHE